MGDNLSRLNKVIFVDAADKGAWAKYMKLFPGVGFGAAYKILQRTYKFGAQPILKQAMGNRFGTQFEAAFGKKTGNDMLHATSGMLVGIGEVGLCLPLDVLKIKAQTNPGSLAGRGVLNIFRQEGFGLYRGWNWTIARNAPGSFSLFGATSFVYTRVFGLEGSHQASLMQMFAGSFAGGVASISVSSPMDVIKVRIQNKAFDDPRSGASLIRDLVRQEGVYAFFKGMTAKLGLIGPKLVFSWTVAQWLSDKLASNWDSYFPKKE